MSLLILFANPTRAVSQGNIGLYLAAFDRKCGSLPLWLRGTILANVQLVQTVTLDFNREMELTDVSLVHQPGMTDQTATITDQPATTRTVATQPGKSLSFTFNVDG